MCGAVTGGGAVMGVCGAVMGVCGAMQLVKSKSDPQFDTSSLRFLLMCGNHRQAAHLPLPKESILWLNVYV